MRLSYRFITVITVGLVASPSVGELVRSPKGLSELLAKPPSLSGSSQRAEVSGEVSKTACAKSLREVPTLGYFISKGDTNTLGDFALEPSTEEEGRGFFVLNDHGVFFIPHQNSDGENPYYTYYHYTLELDGSSGLSMSFSERKDNSGTSFSRSTQPSLVTKGKKISVDKFEVDSERSARTWSKVLKGRLAGAAERVRIYMKHYEIDGTLLEEKRNLAQRLGEMRCLCYRTLDSQFSESIDGFIDDMKRTHDLKEENFSSPCESTTS